MIQINQFRLSRTGLTAVLLGILVSLLVLDMIHPKFFPIILGVTVASLVAYKVFTTFKRRAGLTMSEMLILLGVTTLAYLVAYMAGPKIDTALTIATLILLTIVQWKWVKSLFSLKPPESEEQAALTSSAGEEKALERDKTKQV